MRVLQVAARALSLCTFVLPLMNRLRQAGFQVEALCGFDGNEGRIADEGIPVHRWEMGHTFNPLRLAHARRQLATFLTEHRYDIVHTHCSFGGIVANPIAHGRCGRLVYTQHGFFVHSGMNRLAAWAWLQVEKVGLRWADLVICISNAEREMALSLGVGPPAKFVAIPGAGVRLEKFVRDPEEQRRARARIRAQLGIDENQTVILTVSRLTWDKGYREMLSAARKLKSAGYVFKFVAAGSGRHERHIRRAIGRAGLDADFLLLGWRDDVPDLYCAADIFVFASHREGLPIAPIEAMATGLPVVASDIPGCIEEIEHGQSGLLYPVGDAAALASALETLMNDAELAAKLGRAARRRAHRFDLDSVLDAQMRIYQRLAEEL